jgi:phosphopantetheinyl transferase
MIDTAHTPVDKWSLTSVGDELGADDAHVWRASLDQPAKVITKLAPLLSQDEYQRAMRYHRPVDRDRFIVGRGILRKIISAYLSLLAGGRLRSSVRNRTCRRRKRPRKTIAAQ